jgi:hypothetical protein
MSARLAARHGLAADVEALIDQVMSKAKESDVSPPEHASVP